MDLEGFVKYIADDTKEKFGKVEAEIGRMNTKLDNLLEFKSEMKTQTKNSARLTSLIVSSVVGIVVAFAAEIVKFFKH